MRAALGHHGHPPLFLGLSEILGAEAEGTGRGPQRGQRGPGSLEPSAGEEGEEGEAQSQQIRGMEAVP